MVFPNDEIYVVDQFAKSLETDPYCEQFDVKDQVLRLPLLEWYRRAAPHRHTHTHTHTRKRAPGWREEGGRFGPPRVGRR